MIALIALVSCILGGVSLPVFAQEQPKAPDLKLIEDAYRAEVEAEVTKPHKSAILVLDQKYMESLDRARGSAQEKEQLDLALALANESDRIKKGVPLPAEDDAKDPATLKNLRSIYRKTLAKLEADRLQRLRPLAENHIASLNGVIAQLTRLGKLTEAKTARDILEKLQQEQPTVPRRETSLKEFLPGTKWLWYGAEENEMTFLPDGTVQLTDWTRKGLVTGWRVVGKNGVKLTILKGRDNNKTAMLEFTDDRASFTGTDFNGKAQIAKSPKVP